MIALRVTIIMLMLGSFPVQARMYQWTDPETGTTQLSGKPPAWYRSPENGPRVIVFEKGKIIDDTSISLSDTAQEELRREALLKAVEDKEKAKEMALQAEELKSTMEAQIPDVPPEPDQRERQISLPDIAEPAPVPEQSDMPVYKELTEGDLRALISEWEQQKTQEAKDKVGTDTGISE